MSERLQLPFVTARRRGVALLFGGVLLPFVAGGAGAALAASDRVPVLGHGTVAGGDVVQICQGSGDPNRIKSRPPP